MEKGSKPEHAEWDCREINVPHSPSLVHSYGMEDGLPNYYEQQRGHVHVTICQKCHPRIPGHLIDLLLDGTGIGPDDMPQYFEIKGVEPLFDALPMAYSSSGKSRNQRERIFRYAMQDGHNPYQFHAGKTLRASLGYQHGIEPWKPDEDEFPSAEEIVERFESRYDKYR